MRRVIAWMMGVCVGAAIMFAAFQFHLIRTQQRFLLVRKQQADWRDAYVDVREWSYRDWTNHPRLSENLVAAGHGDVVVRSGADNFFRGFFNSYHESGSDDRSEGSR